MSTRDELRAATLGATAAAATKTVEVNGKPFEIRELSIGEHTKIRAQCRSLVGLGPLATEVIDRAAFRARCVMACTFVPGTQEAVYEAADFDGLMKLPTSCQWYAKLADAVQDLIASGVNAGKPSPSTPAVSASTPSPAG